MDEYVLKDFGKILKRAGLDGRRMMKNTDTDCMRIYDRLIPGLDVSVDLYGRFARVTDYSDPPVEGDDRTEVEDTICRFLYVEKDRIVWKERKKREGREQHGKEDGKCPVVVKENGLEFECELSSYTDTGLFLDMAVMRGVVMEKAKNQRVLNLFSYTSSFSVYAASGGAESVTSVDLSNVYSAWSQRNLERNGFLDRTRYRVVTADCRAFLEEAVLSGEKYDIVIFDPPAFSNSHKAEDFDVQKDHVPFLAAIWKLLSDGGVVYFSENLSGFSLDRAKLEKWYRINEITGDVTAPNFSTRRRSCRIWELGKTGRGRRNIPVMEDREMDEREKKDTEGMLTLREGARAKAAPRVFSFDDYEENEVKRSAENGRRRDEERSSGRRDEGRKPSFGRDERRGGRDGAGRDGRQRYGEGRYQEGRRDGARREERRYSDDRSYGGRREERRYDERRGERRDERRYGEERRRGSDSYRREERGERRYGGESYGERRHGSDSGERRDRGYGKYASDSRTYGGRRDSEGRRDNYKRDSYPSRDRRYYSDRDGDNETSCYYRSERRDEGRRYGEKRDGEKRRSPKPFGYDSFIENKNREGATAFWLAGQEFKEGDDNY